MWRAAVIALGIFYGTNQAAACTAEPTMRGIIFDGAAASAATSPLVLDVVFTAEAIANAQASGLVEAHVRRVVRGEYAGETVLVSVQQRTTCDFPFIFGTEGLIIGELRNGPLVYNLELHGQPYTIRYGGDGAWFNPSFETVRERQERTGVDPLTRPHGILTLVQRQPGVYGDLDGDGGDDTAAFYTVADGNLIVAVRRTTAQNMDVIWGGDISSLPRFSIRAAPPGIYATACDLYGGCGDDVPAVVDLTHEGIFVREDGRENDLLYYWEDGAFRNIIVAN